jgi:hypothetical protein
MCSVVILPFVSEYRVMCLRLRTYLTIRSASLSLIAFNLVKYISMCPLNYKQVISNRKPALYIISLGSLLNFDPTLCT